MRTKVFFRVVLLVVLLTAASLGCQLVNRVREGVQAVGTGQAIATDIGSFATQIIPGGIEETAQAMVTQIDESGLLETAQAAITEQAPGLQDTAQAFTTEVYTSPEQAPADIPVMEGEKRAFVGTAQSVTYTVNAELKDVVAFYKQQMPANGWQASGTSGSSSDNMDESNWEKDGRKANVVVTQIPFVGQTIVAITIEGF
jgi:hypothetical protein